MPIRRMDWRGELRRMPQLPWDFYSQSSIQCTCLTIMETIRKLTSCKDCLFVPLCHLSLSGDPCGCWRGRWWPPLHPYCVSYTGLKSKVKVYFGLIFCFLFPSICSFLYSLPYVLFYIPFHMFCFTFPSNAQILERPTRAEARRCRNALNRWDVNQQLLFLRLFTTLIQGMCILFLIKTEEVRNTDKVK